MKNEKDRYKLNQFYQGLGAEIKYLDVTEISDQVFVCENLKINILPIDFENSSSDKYRKDIITQWINLLPELANVKRLSIRHRVDQRFFEQICEMKNLQELFFWTSSVENLDSIKKLINLNNLGIDTFTKLTDISAISHLKNLKKLSIENSFKISNYEIIGEMTQLIGLRLGGDMFAPKNLKLSSLKPFENLSNLRHLDLSSTTLGDKSIESILKLKNLERFDIAIKIPKDIREKIKNNHKKLKSGFFIDWDFENDKFYEGKYW